MIYYDLNRSCVNPDQKHYVCWINYRGIWVDFHLEGPELIALDVPPTRNYLGNCISEMPYNLMVPGKYHVNMVWWRENYISHSEKGNLLNKRNTSIQTGLTPPNILLVCLNSKH